MTIKTLKMGYEKNNINRGKFLQEIVENSGMSISKLIKKAGYKDRASYYMHIKKADLSFDILKSYANALNYDLSSQFPEISSFILNDDGGQELYKLPDNYEEAMIAFRKLKEKYMLLLEKHVSLIEANSSPNPTKT